jgi:hypothetical protein
MGRRVDAVVGACGRLGGKVRHAYASSTTKVGDHVNHLRESAIEPLPHVERTPLQLRQLEWLERSDGLSDPAGIIRTLRGQTRGAEDRNTLGCAYALLAWELSRDEYWLSAISELRSAARNPDVKSRAKANLERVGAVSHFSVEP